MDHLHMSARAYDRILKVASPSPTSRPAIGYYNLDRSNHLNIIILSAVLTGCYASRLSNSMSTRQMSSMVFNSTRSLVEWGSTMRGPMLAIWMPG